MKTETTGLSDYDEEIDPIDGDEYQDDDMDAEARDDEHEIIAGNDVNEPDPEDPDLDPTDVDLLDDEPADDE